MPAVDRMLVMGGAMDREPVKKGLWRAPKATRGMDCNHNDYNVIASLPAPEIMGVYNAFATFSHGAGVVPSMTSKVNPANAKAAYEAFLAFKDFVKHPSAKWQALRA
mmetsp:Transcript_14939/g.16260  ORF Transcript_14939/g.16260 Transcript_14939/m.16260 type:complete len:107 (+) Transcript_14939:122-442(+)